MIRTTKHTLRWINRQKQFLLLKLIGEYRRVAQLIVDDLWHNLDGFNLTTKQLQLPRYVTTQYLKGFNTWLCGTETY